MGVAVGSAVGVHGEGALLLGMDGVGVVLTGVSMGKMLGVLVLVLGGALVVGGAMVLEGCVSVVVAMVLVGVTVLSLGMVGCGVGSDAVGSDLGSAVLSLGMVGSDWVRSAV